MRKRTPSRLGRSGTRPFSRCVALDDDTKREVQRAAGADERAGQLEIGSRVDEQPAILVAEAEKAELFETPADDALILLG